MFYLDYKSSSQTGCVFLPVCLYDCRDVQGLSSSTELQLPTASVTPLKLKIYTR